VSINLFFPFLFGRTLGLIAAHFVSLKLKLYRSLGIDLEADPATGEYNKAIIRNSTKGDVHVVNVDRDFSRQFYAKYFWDKI
jgi:kinetochore protein Spc24, fungi type